MNNDGWQIESLFKKAFTRTKERFLSYFLAVIIELLIFLATFLVGIVVVGLLIGLAVSFDALALKFVFGLLAILGSITIFLAFIYVNGWGIITFYTVLIQEKKLGVIDTFKKTRSQVIGYVWYSIALSLFMFGLMPFMFLSLGIVALIWFVWASMGIFVYIQHNKKGLDNMWISRSMVKQKFWGILGRLALLYVVYYTIIFILGSTDNSLGSLIIIILSILFSPFAIGYLYEMYKQLSVPKTVEKSKPWVIVSILGYVLGIILFFLITNAIVEGFNDVMQNAPDLPIQPLTIPEA